MNTKKFIYILFTMILMVACNSYSTSGHDISHNWSVNDYGYAKYTISPYSRTLAVIPYNTDSGAMSLASSLYKAAFYSLQLIIHRKLIY